MSDDQSLPKQELLIKLLKMTTSDSDGEALVALRKANALLRSAGWDWERLIQGKIRIAADPFAGLGTPASGTRTGVRTSGNSYNPPNPGRAAPPPPKRTTWPLGITPNKFAGFCYCCGLEVLTNTGFIFKPSQYSTHGSNDWKVACAPCNTTATVQSYAATRQRGTRKKPLVGDLA